MSTKVSELVVPVRRGLPFRKVALGMGALGLSLLVVAGVLYVRFIRYDRVAARHVPPGAAMALRVEVEQALLYEPVRRHLLPLLGDPTARASDGDEHLRRVEAASGVRRGDLREVVFFRGSSPADWGVVLAGLFPGEGAGASLVQTLGAEPGWTVRDGGRFAVYRSGVAVGRATDGAVVVASNTDVLRAALVPSGAGEELGIASAGPGSMALSQKAIAELTRTAPVLSEGDLPALLGAVDRVTGTLVPGEQMGVTLTFSGRDPGAVRRAAEALFESARRWVATPGSATSAFLRPALGRGHLEAPPGGEVHLVLVSDPEELDRALASLADSIRSR